MKTLPPRIFISHSHIDNEFGTRLAQDLRRELGDESSVWYDVLGGLHGGDVWWSKIEQEMSTRNVFIVVLSPKSVSSNYVNDEINMAWARKNDPDPTKRMHLIPVLYQPCEIRLSLNSLHFISFVSPKSYEAAFEELLLALGFKERWVEDGVGHYLAKQHQRAIADFDRAIQLDPQYTDAYVGRGNAYKDTKKHQLAIADWPRAALALLLSGVLLRAEPGAAGHLPRRHQRRQTSSGLRHPRRTIPASTDSSGELPGATRLVARRLASTTRPAVAPHTD